MTDRGTPEKLSIAVLASGEGTNLQAILNRAAHATLPVTVRAVISDRPQAHALVRARSADVAAQTLLPAEYLDREHYDAALARLIDQYAPGLVVLAGFMRILSDDFVRHYRGRLLNVHPALLPKYRGLHTHRRALEAGEHEHGCSVHFVVEELDSGPVIAQARVPVRPDDDAGTLRRSVQRQEHWLYPLVIGWFARGRLVLKNDQAWLDGAALTRPEVFTEEPRA